MVAVRAPARARGHVAGQRTRYLCVAERVTALKAKVSHVRAWNFIEILRMCPQGVVKAVLATT